MEFASKSPVPDLLVGIDFGMTGTGVSYAGSMVKGIQTIRNWPGTVNQYGGKVPSVIAYKDGKVSSWGFGVTLDKMTSAPDIKSFFKGSFDHKDLCKSNEKNGLHLASEEVERWLSDYMKNLYNYIRDQLEAYCPQGRDWNKTNIRFMFSYPTTWGAETVGRFRRLVEDAGFKRPKSSSTGLHEVQVGLDEAKAAVACYFAELELPQMGEYIMIADIGGGTSDVALFEVKSHEEKSTNPVLIIKATAQGMNVGSTKIDEGFEMQVRQRLQEHCRSNGLDPDSDGVSENIEKQVLGMIQSDNFIAEKCSYGKRPWGSSQKNSEFGVQIPFMMETNSELNIENGIMKFDKEKLFRNLFETQCEIVWLQFVGQLKALGKEPQEILDNLHLVLAGGLGSSSFVERYLKDKFTTKYGKAPRCSVLGEPQLAVCRGLVHYGVRRTQGQGVFRYTAHASYGIVQLKKSEPDALQWFLNKDDVVSVPDEKKLTFKIKIEDAEDMGFEVWTTNEKVILGRGDLAVAKEMCPAEPRSLTTMSGNNLARNKFLGLIPSSRYHVTVGLSLDYNSMKYTITQENKEVREAIYVTELWHHPPSVGGSEQVPPRSPPNQKLVEILKFVVTLGAGLTTMVSTIMKIVDES